MSTNSSPSYHIIQHDPVEQLQLLMRKQAEQLVALQAQLKAGKKRRGSSKAWHRLQLEIAKPLLFDRDIGKMVGFVTVCKVYIRIRIRKKTVEEQIQQILIYVQRELANVWKKNILEYMELEDCEFTLARELLVALKILQIQALRVGQVKEPCIGLTQENSIENSVQDGLPYI